MGSSNNLGEPVFIYLEKLPALTCSHTRNASEARVSLFKFNKLITETLVYIQAT